MNLKPNIEILKEPRGFIKGIQLVITIFAFSTLAGFIGKLEFKVDCEDEIKDPIIKGEFSYPFKDLSIYSFNPLCANNTESTPSETMVELGYKSEAEYFVFTGVVAMLFVLVAVAYYVFFEDQQKEATSTDVGLFSFPVVDFVVTVLLVIFWFSCSIAWASALHGLKDATNAKAIITDKGFTGCGQHTCVTKSFDGPTFGAANVSVVFGFLNFFVWGGNLWFLFKETPWHSPKRGGAMGAGPESVPQEPPRQDTPPASAI